ncbi:MAG TPA: hypothetical protein HPP87_03340 [Planctomycetes bacterium]|nr:hypothetical protein [Planctomycetota bacterium]HIJ70378.1 hypothetical protein [Planctomycetota bacterium]
MTQQKLQDEILRQMIPQQKLDLAMRLYYSARELKSAWLHQLHGDWSDQQITRTQNYLCNLTG